VDSSLWIHPFYFSIQDYGITPFLKFDLKNADIFLIKLLENNNLHFFNFNFSEWPYGPIGAVGNGHGIDRLNL
jgi:hypothetical protein